MGAGYRFINKADKDSSAEVFIYEDVGAGWFGGVTAKDFANDLRSAGKVKTIDVRIASYGGDVNDGFAMYRLLADHDARIVVHVDGMAASIASVIAMAGDEIIIAEAGAFMIHDAWTIVGGNARQLREQANRLDKTGESIVQVYAARTKNDKDKIKAWMEAETWFYGKEAADNGFADSVAANVQVANASTLWHSTMQSRIAQNLLMQRPSAGAAQRHPANDDVRQQLAQQAERQRARQAARTTPIPN